MKVKITRFSNNYRLVGEIDATEIESPHWDNVSGGYGARSAGYAIYGYIPYDIAKDLVDCSGRHGFGDNSAKICVPSSLNKAEDYQEGYNYLLKNVINEKPGSIITKHRPTGGKPCTKKILEILSQRENGKILRKELREILSGKHSGQKGYELQTIRQALKTLEKTNRITISKNSSPDKQIITKL